VRFKSDGYIHLPYKLFTRKSAKIPNEEFNLTLSTYQMNAVILAQMKSSDNNKKYFEMVIKNGRVQFRY
jgi:hypothetical protein